MSGSSAELLIRVLADTSHAQAGVSSLMGTLGKAAGIGGAGLVAGGAVQAAIDLQSAMAKVQIAYNSVDFAPGTAKYQAAKDFILQSSTQLATSAGDIAEAYSQGARFVDDFGNKLPTDKVQEYVDTVTRLSKISTDHLAPTDIGQRVDVFEKLYGETNFNQVGSALSELSGIHNQGEGPLLDAANAIAQYGADIGVKQSEALGVANYLVDLKAGGQQGGASLGRLLMRTGTAADSALDPEESYSSVKKQRDAGERLSDLQSELSIAEQKHAEMYGQHGLKKQYAQHPSEAMAANAHLAKLQREIADQSQDMAHLGDPKKLGRGQINIAEMAKTAGEDVQQFANEFKEGPIQAILKFTRGLNELPEGQRNAAIAGAGINNVRDQKTIKTLADRPDVISDYINKAQEQLDHPTNLKERSDIALGTTESKVQDAVNATRGAAATIGEPGREALDKGLTEILSGVQKNGFGPLEQKMQDLEGVVGLANSALGTFVQQLGVAGSLQVATAGLSLLGAVKGAAGAALGGGGGGGGGLASGQGNTTASGAPTSLPGGTIANPGSRIGWQNFAGAGLSVGGLFAADALGKQLATGVEDLLHANHLPSLKDLLQTGEGQANQPKDTRPSQLIMNIGAVHAGADSAEQAFDAIKQQFIAAWTAAMAHQPVSGQMGGNFVSGQGPH